MKKIAFIIVITAFYLTACGNEKKSTASSEMHTEEMHNDSEAHEHGDHEHGDHDHGSSEMSETRTIEATTKKNSATSGIIDAYLQIKNGLAGDDKAAAAQGGKALLGAFSKFDMSKLSGAQHKEYMDIMENAKEQAEHIVKSPIDHQREHFEVLSNDINDLITLLGTDKTLYRDFCPMINDGKGGIWLSETKEIKNPFMGSKMPTCGKIVKQIN